MAESNFYDNPKEYMKIIYQWFGEQNGVRRVIDVGCGFGEFLHFLKGRHPDIAATGVEMHSATLAEAKKRVPGVTFLPGDASNRDTLPREKYDAVFSLFVLAYVDDIARGVNNLVDLCDDNGRVYIFTPMNDYPVDVDVHYRFKVPVPAGREDMADFVMRTYSKDTVAEILGGNPRVKKFRFHDFDIDMDLPQKDIPNSTWTFRREDGKRCVVDRGNHLYVLKFCVIDL